MYWLVSLPLQEGSLEETWRALQVCSSQGNTVWSTNYRFELPMQLRVGSLDKLMVLGDDLSRINVTVEGVVNKIRRQAAELSPAANALTVNSASVETYITRFAWDEAKYPLRKPLQEIVEELAESVVTLDEEMKAKSVDYQSLKQQLQAANRKVGGSLAVKDLSDILSPEDVVLTENLTTIIVTVPAYAKKEVLESYETWCDFIVPRSDKVVAQDADYTLVRVVLFERVVDDFKAAARTAGCQCRDARAVIEANRAGDQAAEVARLQHDLENKKSELSTWCQNSYGDAFTAWIHICAVRLFVESVLRYGLPPKFLATIMLPNPKFESKLRQKLAETFSLHGAAYWKADDDTAIASETKSDMFPYVSFTLDVDA